MKIEYHECDRCGKIESNQSRWMLITYSDFEAQNVTVELCAECREAWFAFMEQRTALLESDSDPIAQLESD